MDPLVISAASALACLSTGGSGAVPAYNVAKPNERAVVLRVAAPMIELSVYPVGIEPELESMIYSSMSRDFERRYAL